MSDDIKGPWLAIQNVNGVNHTQIEWFKNTMSRDGYPTFRIPISAEDAKLGIDIVKRLYQEKIKEVTKNEQV